MQLLGGQQRKPLGEVEPHLVTEHAQGAGAGAVGLLHALGEHPVEQVEVLLHRFLKYFFSNGTILRTAWPRWLMASLTSGKSSPLVLA